MEISKEKLEVYKSAMFPLMLQGIYNAMVTIGFTRAHNTEKLDEGTSKRQTMADLRVILEAFKSIGIVRRFGKKHNAENDTWTLRHFNEDEISKVVELFNPDADERDEELNDIKTRHETHVKTLQDAIAKRDLKIKEINIENSSLKKQLADANDKLIAYSVFPRTTEKLNMMLNYPMTAEEMRIEVRNLLRNNIEQSQEID